MEEVEEDEIDVKDEAGDDEFQRWEDEQIKKGTKTGSNVTEQTYGPAMPPSTSVPPLLTPTAGMIMPQIVAAATGQVYIYLFKFCFES